MIPEGKEIAYECANGHINMKHGGKPRGHDFYPACVECGDRLTRTLVPLRECQNCGNVWPYTGDADRPTCPDCKGKDNRSLAEPEGNDE